MFLWLLLATFHKVAGEAHEANQASEAAAYWRGSRVRQREELNLPTPQIDIGSDGSMSIEYHGYDLVQDCLEYYLDKGKTRLSPFGLKPSLEAKNQQRVYANERDSLKDRQSSLERHRPNAVMVYLLMENAERALHRDLALSLRCLARFFHHYPVVIFHTNSSTNAELQWLLSVVESTPLKVSFEEVTVGFPEEILTYPGGPDAFLSPPLCMLDGLHRWRSNRSCGCRCPLWRPQCWPVNWMHAAHFFTAGMFRTKTFQEGGYDYFFRVDTDLFFVESPVVDPFQLMAEMGCLMVYHRLSREAPGCYDDFDLRSRELLEQIHYVGQPDLDILLVGKGPAAAGGQWTIGDVRFFTSDMYLKFADYMASGIYAHRWSEQIILLRSAALFGPRASIWNMQDPPAVSLCTTPLFPDSSMSDAADAPGLVHLKGGFRQQHLLKTCDAEDVFT